MLRKGSGVLIAFLAVVCLAHITAVALGVSTHRLINLQAAGADGERSFDDFLRTSLGFADGRATFLDNSRLRLTIEDWLGEGGEREDDRFRYVQHFHDPLKPWDSAGLSRPFGRFTSAVRWMQERDQGSIFAENRSWHDARRLYYGALTEADPARREALWADLFQTLGQIMHLVVDASVPEHARNDIHLLGAVRVQPSYERWVGDRHSGGTQRELEFVARYLSTPIGFMEHILDLPAPAGEPVAKVPVARLIDADRYDGSNPHVTVTNGDPRAPATVGLAEIANANFFSEDTLRGEYPHPTTAGLIMVNLTTPFGRVRRYFSRPAGQGLLPANPLRAECATEAFNVRGELVQPPPYPCVDGLVWSQVAAHMLPRAVGYARGVLDYFFRGRVGVQTWRMRLGIAFIQIDNLTGEEMIGVFEIFGRPNAQASGEERERTAVVNGGAAATIKPFGSVTLPLTYLQPEHPTPSQILVFRGRIGLEEDAVAAQVFTVPHVLIAQTAHTADLRETCGTRFEYPFRSLTESCDWRPTNGVNHGELITNRSANVIARVSLTPQIAGNELVLDGVPVPGGVWQRQGDEPDPHAYSIRWSPWLLTLTVQLVDGTVVTSTVYGSIAADAEARKGYTDSPAGSDPPWYVYARRFARVAVSPHASYRVVSVSGYPNPTNIRTDRFSIPNLVDILTVDDNNGNPRYVQWWTDHANVYWTAPPRGPVLLQKPLETEFAALSFGPVPRVPVEAVLERNYRPGELVFLRTFVTRASPPSTLTVVGQRPSGT